MKKLLFILTICNLQYTIYNYSTAQDTTQVQTLEPTETAALLNVIVENDKQQPNVGDIITFTSKKDSQVYKGVTDAAGHFSILVPKEQTYSVKGYGKDEVISELEMPAFDGYLNYDFTIIYEMPKTFTLRNVYFDSDKATLKPASDEALNNLKELMVNKKNINIEISGHTDNTGGKQHNQTLSQNRAAAVRTYLINKGIAATRTTSVGFGDTKPIDSNDNPEGKQNNRRVEVKVLPQ